MNVPVIFLNQKTKEEIERSRKGCRKKEIADVAAQKEASKTDEISDSQYSSTIKVVMSISTIIFLIIAIISFVKSKL